MHSYVEHTEEERRAYVGRLAEDIEKFFADAGDEPLSTLYFGGGTPALCDLSPLFEIIRRREKLSQFEFTVELNPLDVSPPLLERLRHGGVNRISMGVQSFDDATLKSMGRLHNREKAIDAWHMIREAKFDNAGIDLICGWPCGNIDTAPSDTWKKTIDAAIALKPDHCSIYTLILEQGTRLSDNVEKGLVSIPSDDFALEELAEAERHLKTAGIERYEISSFAKPGKECRHNLATWRGEDYTGIGDGACSREGNAVSRVIFRLRLLKEGFSPSAAADAYPELAPRVAEWCETLDRFAAEGLLSSTPSEGSYSPTYRLTPRGTEVCDTILAELI